MGLSRKRFKGHCGVEAMMTGRVRGQGWAERLTVSELSRFGKRRRLSRQEIPADQLEEVEDEALGG